MPFLILHVAHRLVKGADGCVLKKALWEVIGNALLGSNGQLKASRDLSDLMASDTAGQCLSSFAHIII